MALNRRSRLHMLRILSLAALIAFFQGFSQSSAQQPAPQTANGGQQNPPPQQQQQQQPPKPQPPPQQKSPFQNVPVAPAQQPPAQPPTPAPPTQPKLEAPQCTPKQTTAASAHQTVPGAHPKTYIEAIEFRGSRRVPQDTLRALIYTKKGDPYDEEKLRRDFMALWNTGRFDDIRLEREPGQTGWIIRFVVTERPVVRSIKYEGNKSITVSEILDRFKERKVGLVVEQQYDPNKVQRAKNVILELLSERGHQYAKVDRRDSPRAAVFARSHLQDRRRPQGQGGQHHISQGNTVFSDKDVIRAMKNLHPIGIPHSILFENLFAKTYDSTKLEEDKSRVQNFYQEHGYFVARVDRFDREDAPDGPGSGTAHPADPAQQARHRGRHLRSRSKKAASIISTRSLSPA